MITLVPYYLSLTPSSVLLSPSQLHVLFLFSLINQNPITVDHTCRRIWPSTGGWATYQSFIIKEEWWYFHQQLLTACHSFHRGGISVALPPSYSYFDCSCPTLLLWLINTADMSCSGYFTASLPICWLLYSFFSLFQEIPWSKIDFSYKLLFICLYGEMCFLKCELDQVNRNQNLMILLYIIFN